MLLDSTPTGLQKSVTELLLTIKNQAIMKILYWYYKSRMNKKGAAPIRMRITIDGERADLKTGIEIQEEK